MGLAGTVSSEYGMGTGDGWMVDGDETVIGEYTSASAGVGRCGDGKVHVVLGV